MSPSDQRGRRLEHLWAPLLYLFAAGFLYRALLGGEVGFGWDTIESYWPDLRYIAGNIERGQWSLWNPYDRGGYPFYADPQPGATYPVQWLFALASAAADHGWWLIQIKVLVHHAIAGLAMHAFLRSRGLCRAAAVVGGLTWLGSTPMLIHKASNVLWPLVWMPVVWIAIDALIARPTWRRGVALAGVLYVAGSAGSPPGFFYVLLASVLYGGFRMTSRMVGASAERRKLAASMITALALAAVLTALLLAITYYPGLALTEETTRSNRTIGYALALPMPVTPTLQGLFAPALASPDAYLGIGAMMLAFAALFMAPKRDGGAPVFFAVLAAFALALAFGAATPVLEWLVRHVPGFGLFRVSNRYKLLFAPAIAALAGYGAHAIIGAAKRWSRERITAIAVVAAVVAIGLALALVLDGPAKPLRSRWVAVAIALLSAGLIGAGLYGSVRASRIRIAVLAGLIFLDPAYTLFARQPVMEKQPLAGAERALDGLEGIETVWRIHDEFLVGERAGSRFRVRDFRGYPSGDPLDFRRYREILQFAGKHPEILEAFNVRYVLHHRHGRNGFRAHRVKTAALRASDHFAVPRDSRRDVYEALHPAPLLAWYGAVREHPRREVLPALLEADRADGARAFAVLEPDVARHLTAVVPDSAASGAEISGALVSRSPDRLEVTIDAPSAGLVVLAEVDYAGWRVEVDGVEAVPLRANYLLRAVEVGPGAHRIVWRFEPPGFTGTVLAFALGWLGLLVALGVGLGVALGVALGRRRERCQTPRSRG